MAVTARAITLEPPRALVASGYSAQDPRALRALADVASRALVEHHHFARLLDSMTPEQRHVAVRACGGVRRIEAIYRSCAGASRLRLEDVVPGDRAPLTGVRYLGKNSLPVFTRFEKHFCWAEAGPNGQRLHALYGYNKNWYAFAVAHGYYTAYDTDDALGGVAVDYRKLPARGAAGWPRVISNHWLIGAFVWPGMVDYLRRVSRDVLVGVAVRHGVLTRNYFLLSRAA